MKKIIVLSVFCVLAVNAIGQISIISEGNTKRSSYLVKDDNAGIRKIDGVYHLLVFDVYGNEPLYIQLGSSEAETMKSLETIINWYINAKNKSYIEFDGGYGIITMYKASGRPWFSNNSVDCIKDYIKTMVYSALLETDCRKPKLDGTKIGYLSSINQLQRAYDKLKSGFSL